MLTLELPVLVSVTVCMALLPTVTLPKLRLAGLAVSCGVAATPVPLIAMVVGEAGALLTKDTPPLTPSALVAEKATLKLVFCPGVRVKGRVNPIVAKPFPVTVHAP